jgi:hypothetical protein
MHKSIGGDRLIRPEEDQAQVAQGAATGGKTLERQVKQMPEELD